MLQPGMPFPPLEEGFCLASLETHLGGVSISGLDTAAGILDKRIPLLIKWTLKCFASSASIPIIGVPCVTFFAVKIGMDSSAYRIRFILNRLMGLVPIIMFIVPERLKSRGESGWGTFCRQGINKGF